MHHGGIQLCAYLIYIWASPVLYIVLYLWTVPKRDAKCDITRPQLMAIHNLTGHTLGDICDPTHPLC